MPFDDYTGRLNEAVMSYLGDGAGTYHGVGFTATEARYILDRDFEVYDEDQVAMRVTSLSVEVAVVPSSRQGDSFVTADRTWTVQQILNDDGQLRRLWVT